ncbi:alpha-2-macroglobulin-like [Hyperolius riggenbachi]|uniref:alpha-2-macroglobulin-like n=1 Tax=Hyperolius riggenbachi TaxID=752182 RepID=UPI0035A32FD6
MQLLLVTLCLAVCSSALVSASEPHYVITVPGRIQEGSEEKACVTFHDDLHEPVKLKFELRKDDHVQVVAEQSVDGHDYTNCFPFKVPAVEASNTRWSFHVSAHGEHINVDESQDIIIDKAFDVCLIQTDKTVYKPGDTANDPNNNRIGQWRDVVSNHGFADFSFHLAKDLKHGEYRIHIPEHCETDFRVTEYVSKRFEMHMNLPTEVSVADKSFPLEIRASYVYGKPVEGTVDIEICPERHYSPFYHEYIYRGSDDDDSEEENNVCTKLSAIKTDAKGSLSKEIDLQPFNFTEDDPFGFLQINTVLTEDGTGHKETDSANLFLSNHKKVKFVDTSDTYHKGIPFSGTVKAVDDKNQPKANTAIVISKASGEDRDDSPKFEILHKLETDKDGLAHFTLKTDSWEQGVTIIASYPFDEDETFEFNLKSTQDVLWLWPYYSPSDSSLTVQSISDRIACDSDQSVKVEYRIKKENLDAKADHISFFYHVLSKDGIHTYKEHKVDLSEQTSEPLLHSSFVIPIHVGRELSPFFSIIVHTVLPKGEALVDRTPYRVAPCLKNKVELKFSKEQVHPGDKVDLGVTAEPGSYCSVRSLDKGFLLQHPLAIHSFAETFGNLIIAKQESAASQFVARFQEARQHECPENQTLVNRYEIDPARMFEENNIKIFTNTQIRKPLKCVEQEEEVVARSGTLKAAQSGKKEEKREHRTRSKFPDTWLFDLVEVDSEGHGALHLTTPDTITKWESDAVCLGPSGIGETKDVSVTAFQHFFVDLILPSSVVQGEMFKIETQVYSFEDKCYLVGVSLADSDGIETNSPKEQVRCVCDHHSTHFSWDVKATKSKEVKIHVDSGALLSEGECKEDLTLIGSELRVDSIEKTIRINHRGYEQEVSETHLLHASDTIEKVEFNLKSPEGLIAGSERAHIIVLGNLMGNIIVNLEHLIRLPDGCGEQNVAKFTRYLYSLDYLEHAKELKPDIKEKLVEGLSTGYQRELTFKNQDGAYGFWNGGEPSLWITALVAKAFCKAQKYIHVDPQNIEDAIHWLESQQQADGCFHENEYFDSDLVDAEGDTVRTAYVLNNLLAGDCVHKDTLVEKALSCIRNGEKIVKSPYGLASLAYAFTLAHDDEHRTAVLKRLHDSAVKEEGTLHWEAEYLSVETTSYAVLALLSGKTTSKQDLEESADAVRWLTSQQNPWGGYHTSKDTTFAVQALAIYAKATSNEEEDATVTIDGEEGFHKEIHIDKTNSLLLQIVDLPKVPGTYTASVKGHGCVYLQSHVHYFSIPDEHEHNFDVKVTTDPSECKIGAKNKYKVKVEVSYKGKRVKTSMAVINVEFPSGHVANTRSIRKLEKQHNVKKVEVSTGKMDIYLHELEKQPHTYVFTLERKIVIENLHPANVLVYDYYSPDIHSHEVYHAPCIQEHCAVSADAREDCGFSGITQEQCEKKGCCYDSSAHNIKWCFSHGHKSLEEHDDHHSEEKHD